MSNSFYVPKKNRNPLLKFPREHSCICGSGERFDECCLKYQRRAIPEEWAARITQVWGRLLAGELRIVPPKEAQRAEQQDTPMPDVPMVPGEEERVLAGAAEAAGHSESVDSRAAEANVDSDQGGRSQDAVLQPPGGEEVK